MSSTAEVLARKVLGLLPNEKVDSRFLPLLQNHLEYYPHDDSFLLNAHDPDPYGSITCIEENCNCDLNLTPDAKVADGGAARGVDIFTKAHITGSAQHSAARDKRVALRDSALKRDVKRNIKPQVGQGHQSKRPSSPSSDEQDAKKLKTELAFGERVNDVSPVRLQPNAAPAVAPIPAHAATQQSPLEKQNELMEQLRLVKKNSSINEQALAHSLSVSDAYRNDPTYWDRIDELKRAIASDKQKQATLQAETALLAARQQVHLAAPIASGSGTGAGAAAQRLAAAAASGAGGVMAGAAEAVMDAIQAARDRYGGMDDDNMGIPGVARAAEEDFTEFIRQAAEGSDFEGNATVDEAATRLGLKTQKECPPHMVIPLMPHQLIGVEWLRTKEGSKHYGGILGDEMGLGKTVQTIGLMAMNPSQEANEKTTLIVAPLALLSQWKEEIESKMEADFYRILIHHGSDRAKTSKQLLKYDVVLTTYQTLAGEWPDEENQLKAIKRKKKKALLPGEVLQDDSDDDDFVAKKPGPLFETAFYRVVLDEAQNIRNRNTKVSRAVARLDSLFRWCLTGTPITNSLSDVQPMLRFLQVKPWFEWKSYNDHITKYEKKNPSMAGKRAQVILKTVLLRRKKDSTLDGKPLITLPPKVVELQVLEFTPEEREIYNFVETRSQATFNKYLKAGTVLKNYAHVLVMLLRLRQLCLHPCLIADGVDALAKDAEDEQKLADELEQAEKALGEKAVQKIRKARLAVIVARIKSEKTGEEMDEDDDCPICLDQLGSDEAGAVVTKCGHSFCRRCITDVLDQPEQDVDEGDENAPKYKAGEHPCPSCRAPVSKKMLWNLMAFDPTNEEITEATGHMNLDDVDLEADSEGDESEDEDEKAKIVSEEEEEDDAPIVVKNKGKGKARAVLDSDDEDEEKDKVRAAKVAREEKRAQKTKERAPPTSWMASQEPSTKMMWLLKELQRVEEEFPEEKTLVLSQFTTALDIVDDYLRSNGIKTVRFQGDMSMRDRDDSVRVFMKSKKCKVMLMSLKCGGVGLNLTRGNRVVNLDLGWSHAVEAQAFDRVHRIGQLRDVRVDRLTIANTVEQRVGDMQERKKLLADTSLGEGAGTKIGKLTVNDLAALFGVRVN